LKQIYQYLKYF